MISLQKSISELFKRRALFLSANRAAVYHWDKGDLGTSYLFDLDQDGLENFNRYLKETPKIPLGILVDIFDEEYRREVIPHVFGSDRNAIIERKQARLFRDTPYLYAKVQGREETGRRDDKILFSAIMNPALISPWVDLLDRHKVPLTGINSLPLFTESLIDSLPRKAKNMLIVSLQRIGGLRQTYFRDNEFRISRLVQMPAYGTTPYGPFIDDEVEKIHRYLMSMRLTTIEDPLDIYFFLSGELLEESKKRHVNIGILRYHSIDIDQLCKQSGSSVVSNGPFSDHYFMYEFLKQRQPNHYAAATETRYATLRLIRHSMLAATLLISLGGAIWSGLNFFDGLILKQNSVSAEKKTLFYSARYEIARERLPATPVDAADLKVAVELAGLLEQHKASPVEMVKVLSRVLDKYYNIKLKNIEWMASMDPNSEIAALTNNRRRQEYVPAPVNARDQGYRFYQIAVVNGYLDPFDGDFREAIAGINEFVEILRNQNSIHAVEILAMPLDISSEASLRGSTETREKDARFSIRVVLGIGNET